MARRDTQAINVGSNPNDGTGEPIREGFIKVNYGFGNIDQRLIDGNLPIVVSNVITSNNATVSNLTVTARAVITPSTTLTINPGAQGDINNVRIGATTPRAGTFTNLTADTITSNGVVTILGNLVVSGNVVTESNSDLVIQDSIINLHTPSDLNPLPSDDGKDIGIKFHYYKGTDGHAFLGWANDTGHLEYYAAGNEVGNVFTGTAYGTVKAGGLLAVNSTASTSTTTGAVVITGGLGVGGAIYSGSLNTTSLSATTVGATNLTGTSFESTTAHATNFSSGNAQISGGNGAFTTLTATNFSTGNAVISGGNAQGILFLQATNFSTGNAAITGGTIGSMVSVAGTSGTFTNLYSDNHLWANGVSLLSGVDTNITNLWSNAAAQASTIGSASTDLSNLWSNAAAQATTLGTHTTDISNLWSNAATQATTLGTHTTDISNLWSNAATQATEIAAKAPTDNPSFTTHVGVTGNVDVTGYVIATQDVIAFSDEKYKTNVTTITNALATVRKLRGVHYDRTDTGEPGTGVVAQESLPHTPRLVRKTDNGDLAVAYGNHAGYFIEAIKELADTVDKMAQDIKMLKEEIKRLKGE